MSPTLKPRGSRLAAYLPYVAVSILLLLVVDVYLKLQTLTSSAAVPSFVDAMAEKLDRRVGADAPPEKQPVSGEKVAERGEQGQCQPYVLYWKPPKTGSTAVTDAARWWVATLGHSDYRCGINSCGPYAEGVCEGRLEKRQLLGHLMANYSTVDCLKDKGYYVVTSNRDPMERWRSAWRYNIQHKATHYGIPWQVNFTEWMGRVPDCVLHNYYDGEGRRCKDEEDTRRRIDKIVSMVDEVVDLYDDDYKGPMHESISPFLGESNVSDVGNRTLKYHELPEDIDARLNPERELYKALREKSKLGQKEGRRLCVQDIKKLDEDVEV